MIDPTCSFCGKSRREVLKLLAKGEAMICDECVQYCVERPQPATEPRPPAENGLARLKRRIARAELDAAQPLDNLLSIEAGRAKAQP